MSSSDPIFTDVVNRNILKRKAICSYSVIVHTIIEGKIHYLIGQVRDTIPFKEFIRGHISDADMPRYILHMSKKEKYRLLSEPFQELVDDVIVNHATKTYRTACEGGAEFERCLDRHESLLLDPNVGLRDHPWMFPKGRKQALESDAACALREFEEETRIPASMITLYPDAEPLEEIYTGLDNRIYKTVYFFGYIDYLDYTKISSTMRTQFIVTAKRVSLSEEIAKIKWVPYTDALTKLDSTKQYLLRAANTFLVFSLKRTTPTRRHSL